VEALRAGLSDDPAERDELGQARWLLASSLDYHRREAKPEWWRWFELRDRTTIEERIEAADAIGGLEFVEDVGVRKRSVIRRYRFPPQDHRFRVGDDPIDPDPNEGQGEQAGQIVAIDDADGTIDLLRGPAKADHHPRSLIPGMPYGTEPLREGLARLADDVIARGLEASGRFRAARDLLARRRPRLRSGTVPGAPLRRPGETVLEAGCRLVVGLDESVLAVQGPPGTGKTYSGARMVLAALDAGLGPIGVTAQSHKVIGNALEALSRAALEAGRPIRIAQKCDEGQEATLPDLIALRTNEAVDRAIGEGSVDVIGGTAWVFARPELDRRLGLLVVDEAGQLALATVLAASGAARSLLLLGDPNQLAQVTQGLHPDGADASALGHVLGGAATIAADRGLFLDRTWRMHPDVNDYISELFYAGRLGTEPSTARQRIDAPGPANGTGVRWLPERHVRNEQRSREEARTVAALIAGLIGEPWIDQDGHVAPLTIDDVLVVAPYNAQVALVLQAIEDRIGHVDHDRVGTVDKFQGREGAVAIYTMAASSAEDAPRGMDFLYDVHRLNVAVSRARAVAVIVASPELLRVAARTPDQMRLANALCRYVEIAVDQASR
jgi:uncharacterized protein